MRAKHEKSAREISNPDKIFWPEEKYTKGDLANFYRDIFTLLRPYVIDRMLTLERCPDGMNGQCFYQKQKPESLPRDTPTKRIQNATGKRKATDYVLGGKLFHPTGPGKSRMHSCTRYRNSRQAVSKARLDLLRPRSEFRQICRRRLGRLAGPRGAR
jgi:hypothetical protein